jgi:hypothetical protein
MAMQKCPHCEKMNASKQTFCGSCGELIHLDPGFEKRVRQVLGQERRRGRARIAAAVTFVLALAGYFGHQYVKTVIAEGIAKATPVVEAKIAAHLDEKVSQELPSMIARSEEREFPKIARELQASHQKRMRDLQESYERQAKADEERFNASLAAAQPALRVSTATSYPFPNIGAGITIPNTTSQLSSTLRPIDTSTFPYNPTSIALTCCTGLVGSSINSLENKIGTDCFVTATLISTSTPGVTGSTVSEAGGCKDRFVLPKQSDLPTAVIQPSWDPLKSPALRFDPTTGRLVNTSQQ